MQDNYRVALIIETSISFGRELLKGINKYLQAEKPWSIYIEQHQLWAMPAAWVMNSSWDGIISRPTDKKLAAMFKQMNVPVIDLNDHHDNLGIPRVCADNVAIGELGARHLIERGFRNFAYCGFESGKWCNDRLNGFRHVVEEKNFFFDSFLSSTLRGDHGDWQAEQKALEEWLIGLPKPLALMTCNDIRAQHVMNACKSIDIAIPENIAVIGVDNSDLFCELCDPPLSSINPDAESIGYHAAKLLHNMMQGKDSSDLTLIQPKGIITRQSSDILAIDDEVLCKALHYIRENACSGAVVDDIIRQCSVSRSLLERRFRKYLNRSPQAEIRQVQVNRIKELLSSTDLSLKKIAELTGFEHPEYMSYVFKKIAQVSPGQFRKSI